MNTKSPDTPPGRAHSERGSGVSSFTPGPWTGFLGSDGVEQSWLIGPSSARPIVAYVQADDEAGLTGATVEANARLIAAAPELLEIVRRSIAACAYFECSDENHQLARAVVAKVEGTAVVNTTRES